MTPYEAALAAVLPQRSLPRWMTGLVAVSTAFAGIVVLVLLFAGPATYVAIAQSEGFERIPFHVPASAPVAQRRPVTYDLATRVALHEATLAYVLSDDDGTPRDPTTQGPLFDVDEQAHLTDVRGVFTAVRVGALVALAMALAVVWSATRAGRAVVLRFARGASIVATVVVAAVAAIFAVAFEPAFLAFHYVFFPQGNFLFDPATSNLLALYPEQYWYSVTLRIGVTFITVMVVIAIVCTVLMRRATAR